MMCSSKSEKDSRDQEK